MLSLDDIRRHAEQFLGTGPDEEGLDPLSRALIIFATRVSITSLNVDAIRDSIAAARKAGASTEQVHEILSLVSGLGVHSLMVSAALAAPAPAPLEELDEERRALWQRFVGDDPYWAGFEGEVPGFLAALLTLSPASFKGFFDYCAIAWSTRSVPAMVKELAAMACDATPQHRFGPGFRLHLANARKLGAGRIAILETLEIAAATPVHEGVA